MAILKDYEYPHELEIIESIENYIFNKTGRKVKIENGREMSDNPFFHSTSLAMANHVELLARAHHIMQNDRDN